MNVLTLGSDPSNSSNIYSWISPAFPMLKMYLHGIQFKNDNHCNSLVSNLTISFEFSSKINYQENNFQNKRLNKKHSKRRHTILGINKF